MKDPGVLAHVARVWQLCVPRVHSSGSPHTNPFPL